MPSKPSLVLWAAALLALACSENGPDQRAAVGTSGSGSGGEAVQTGDDRASVPENLANTPLDGQVADGLTLVAFTLKLEASGPALYAAVRNDRPTPACEAGMTTYFVDRSGQVVTTATSVLESAQFYRVETGAIIRCVAPGKIAMTAALELPQEVVLDDLGSLQHTFPAFTVDDIALVEALTLSNVHSVTTGVGKLYAGTLENRLDLRASAPRVAVFSVNRVGRPLGMATANAASDLPPGASWSFETGNLHTDGVDYAAFPAATFTH